MTPEEALQLRDVDERLSRLEGRVEIIIVLMGATFLLALGNFLTRLLVG